MASVNKIIKSILNVNNVIIDSASVDLNERNEKVLKVHLHPQKKEVTRCPICGRKCSIYDRTPKERMWRGLDAGGLIVELYYRVNRVVCPEHNVVVESVPWAFHNSGFTKDFDMVASFIALATNKTMAAKYMRCDWKTILRSLTRTRNYIEPDPKKRLDGLVNIGIDETSYCNGHNYITVVVNHDTNTVVWVGLGHSTETLSEFFELLTTEQRQSIKNVSGDGARWIDACIKKYIPHATRCVDGFHVVTWAMEAIDSVRKDIWRDAQNSYKEAKNTTSSTRGRPSKEEQTERKKLDEAKEKVSSIKNAKYALGKAPENLTENQKAKLDFISNTHAKLFRAYKLKELLRLVFKQHSREVAEKIIDSFFWKATHSRIQIFKELAHKIKRHKTNILNTIEQGLSNARVESINNKIKLSIRKAYGFRNYENMVDMIMLVCSKLSIPLPNRGVLGMKVM